jgi:hypothetical protein
MRGWVCRLQLLLVLASVVNLRSASRGTRNHILLSQIRDSPNLVGQVPVFIFPRNRVTRLYSQTLGSLFIASDRTQQKISFPNNSSIVTEVCLSRRCIETVVRLLFTCSFPWEPVYRTTNVYSVSTISSFRSHVTICTCVYPTSVVSNLSGMTPSFGFHSSQSYLIYV